MGHVYLQGGSFFDTKSQQVTHTSSIWVFPKIGVPPNHPILIGFSIMNHPFWGFPPIFGNTHILLGGNSFVRWILVALLWFPNSPGYKKNHPPCKVQFFGTTPPRKFNSNPKRKPDRLPVPWFFSGVSTRGCIELVFCSTFRKHSGGFSLQRSWVSSDNVKCPMKKHILHPREPKFPDPEKDACGNGCSFLLLGIVNCVLCPAIRFQR